MRHRLGLATRTQISVCMSPFPSAGTAVPLFRAKMVQQRPLLLREVETRLPHCGVQHTVTWHHFQLLSTIFNQHRVSHGLSVTAELLVLTRKAGVVGTQWIFAIMYTCLCTSDHLRQLVPHWFNRFKNTVFASLVADKRMESPD